MDEKDISVSDEDAIIWASLMDARYNPSKPLLEILEELKKNIMDEIMRDRK